MSNPENPLIIDDSTNNDSGSILSGFVIGIAFVSAGVVAGGLITHFWWDASSIKEVVTKNQQLQTELDFARGQDLDVEKAKAETETAKASTIAAEQATVEVSDALKVALNRLDSDNDKVEIPADLCPNSKIGETGETWVNSKGCLNIEIAMSCGNVPTHPVDSMTNWIFSGNCTLSDDPTLEYSCIAEYTANGWIIDSCDSYDPTMPGG